MFNTIFTVSLSVLLAIFVVVGLLIGRKRRWFYALSRLVVAIAAGVSAFFISKPLANYIGKTGYNILISKLPASITDYTKDITSAPDIFSALVAVILAPILFILLFFVIRTILNVIVKNVCIIISKGHAKSKVSVENTIETAGPILEDVEVKAPAKAAKKIKVKKAKKVRRSDFIRAKGLNPAGMACGVACGLIVFFVIMVPFVGIAAMADDVMTLASKFISDQRIATVTEATEAATTNPVSATIGDMGGKRIFTELTTSKMGDHEFSLKGELDFVTTTGNAVYSAINTSVPRKQAADDIRAVSVAFSKSNLIPTIVPDVLSAANECWDKGESFHGINKITAPGDAQQIVDPLVDVIISSDYDTIKSDADTVIQMVAIIVENDAINTAISNPMSIPEREEVIAPIFLELLENERFTTVINAVAGYGINYLGKQLHLHEHEEALYDEFIAEMADKTSAIIISGRADELSVIYTKLFDDYGLSVSNESVELLAQKTLASYSDGNIKTSDIEALLASTEITFKNGDVVKIDSADVLKARSVLICIDQINIDISKVTNKEQESKALATAVHEVFSLISLINTESIKDANSIKKIGPALDALASTETIGADGTGYLLTGMLQSDLIHNQIGYTLINATDVANSIRNSALEQGYTPLVNSLSTTVEIVQNVSSLENMNKEELVEKVETLLVDLTPESAEVLQTLVTPEVMINQGMSEESATPTANLITSMFSNISSAKENGMSDEEIKKATEGTSNLLDIVSGNGIFNNSTDVDDDENDESDESEEGGEDNTEESTPSESNSMTAADYIDSVMDSVIISQTIVDAAYTDDNSDVPVNDPLNIGKTLSEKEQANVLESLNDHWSNATEDQKSDPEYFKTYAAIGAFVNFPVVIDPVTGTIVAVTPAE